MGKKDTMTKAYMSKGKYFADAFNAGVFDGMPVVKADEMSLQEMDPTELGIVFVNEEKEIVSILAPNSIRNQILEDVNREFGLKTDAQGIVLSIPVDKVFKI